MSYDQHEKSAVHELQHQPYEPLLPIEITRRVARRLPH
jgi:hypothetical protein